MLSGHKPRLGLPVTAEYSVAHPEFPFQMDRRLRLTGYDSQDSLWGRRSRLDLVLLLGYMGCCYTTPYIQYTCYRALLTK